MMISSSRQTAPNVKVSPQSQAKAEESTPSFADTFARQAPAEIGRAVGYSTLAGLSAAAIGHLVSVGTNSLPSALALGIGAAAGAAFGLVSGVGVSAFKAATQSAPTPPPAPPGARPAHTSKEAGPNGRRAFLSGLQSRCVHTHPTSLLPGKPSPSGENPHGKPQSTRPESF